MDRKFFSPKLTKAIGAISLSGALALGTPAVAQAETTTGPDSASSKLIIATGAIWGVPLVLSQLMSSFMGSSTCGLLDTTGC